MDETEVKDDQEYVILLATDPSTLASQVNRLRKKGWEAQGGVAVAVIHEEGEGELTQWAQAMIKPDSSQ